MLATLTKLTAGLIVYPENMKRNLALSLGLWNSQTVLLALIKKGLTREAAYELVQRNAMLTWRAKHAGRDDADFLRQLRLDLMSTSILPAANWKNCARLIFTGKTSARNSTTSSVHHPHHRSQNEYVTTQICQPRGPCLAAGAAAAQAHRPRKKAKRRCVSTWPFGKASNDATMKILLDGGAILDAVERGIWVTEDAAPTDRSAWRAPQRCGFVQLGFLLMFGPGHKAGSVRRLKAFAIPFPPRAG